MNWQSIEQNYGNVTYLNQKEIHGTQLSSTYSNDDIMKVSLFKHPLLMSDKQGNFKIEFNFWEVSLNEKVDFGMYCYFKDFENNLLIGFRQDGWYLETSIEGVVERYSIKAFEVPKRREKISLKISIRAGEVELNISNQHYKKSLSEEAWNYLKTFNKSYIRLGTQHSDPTAIVIEALYSEYNESKPLDSIVEINETEILYNDKLTIVLDKKFPRIVSYLFSNYKMKFKHTEPTVLINYQSCIPKVVFKKTNNTEALYRMKCKDEKNGIDTEIKAIFKLQGNVVHFKIDEIQNFKNPIELIDLSHHHVLAFDVGEPYNPQFYGAKMSTNTHQSGDCHHFIAESPEFEPTGYMYGVMYNDHFAATMWSNSQYSYGGRSEDYTRLTLTKKKFNDTDCIGLAPSPWWYQKVYKEQIHNKSTWDLPEYKVIFTEDCNGDGMIDWQDGAIAYREIMQLPLGHEKVRDAVATRISMNFGSQAQNPFLQTLDNLKKVFQHTDGLGQSIMLKGYGNEGHDSGHLNYHDIGNRMGGEEDFIYLLKEAPKYNAEIGIHINVSETYPESPIFEENLLRKVANNQLRYGWNWIDQGVNIDSELDLLTHRNDRFKKLKKVVGNDLGFVYVDVWGNHESGDERAWQTHQLAKQLHAFNWRLGFEWGFTGEYDSTFQHWAIDMPYGGYALKGINSKLARFIGNHLKDSWIGDYEEYGGAANYPILGGLTLIDFEGWQGRTNYNAFIENVFKTNLPTKFIQRYKIMKWEDGSSVLYSDNDETYSWIPEHRVILENEDGDQLVVERCETDIKSPLFRQRTMRLNNQLIYNRENYVIPWDKDKWYVYMSDKVNSEWEWHRTDVLYLYKLTTSGKIFIQAVHPKNDKITLDLELNQPYVLLDYRATDEEVLWTDSKYINDASFNDTNLTYWKVTGDGNNLGIKTNKIGQTVLSFRDVQVDSSVSQMIKNLKANTSYVIVAAVENRTNALAGIKVKFAEKEVSTEIPFSSQKNYVQADDHHDLDCLPSYFQNVHLYFTTKEQTDVKLELMQRKSAGETQFDHIRIIENNTQYFDEQHDTKDFHSFKQDFENVPQGIYPFVISEAEGVEDNRIHLSQKNSPYTQRGYRDKKINDVIDGEWSLKVNGLVGLDKLLMRTISQNIRFKENQLYQIEFDYEIGSSEAYSFVIGNGETIVKQYPLASTWLKHNDAQHFIVSFVAESDTWIGFYSNSEKPMIVDETSGDINFKSYLDLVIDNLLIHTIS